MNHETTVPRELVVQLAASIHELHAVRLRQHATMAQMIRQCVHAIECKDLPSRDAGHMSWLQKRDFAAKSKHDAALAILHLEWLATQLENETGTLDLGGHEPILVAQ